MFPVLFQFGPILIQSLWFFSGLAFILGVFVFIKLARLKRLNINFIYKYSFYIFLWGLIAARLIFVVFHYQYYFPEISLNSFLSILSIWQDKGISLLGAILGITGSIIYYSWKEKEQTLKWLDILSISAISAIAIGNIGSFLDGTNYGNVTNLPWGIVFDNPMIKYAVPIHPVQIYAFIYSAIISLGMFYIYKNKNYKPGTILQIGLISYFGMLFLEGFLRGDDVIVFLGIREEQWFSLLILIITGSILLYRYNKKRKNHNSN